MEAGDVGNNFGYGLTSRPGDVDLLFELGLLGLLALSARVPDDGSVVQIAENIQPVLLDLPGNLFREATVIPAVDPVVVAERREVASVDDHVVELERHAHFGREALVEVAEGISIPEVLVLVQLRHKPRAEAVRIDRVDVILVQALVEALQERVDEAEVLRHLRNINVIVDALEVLLLVVVVLVPVHGASGLLGLDAAQHR